MTRRAILLWSWVHTWTSLVCTLFMLLLCITGLPLIFHDEIEHALGRAFESEAPASVPAASLDSVLAAARARHPGRIVQFASQQEDRPGLWFVTLTPTPEPTEDFKSIAVDARSARVLGEPPTDEGFMYVMLKLHVELFAGLPGKLFLGFMGLLLLASIVSGIVLYAPFMRRLPFGTVRHDRAARTRWLDLHNLLGIATVAWAIAVAATGVVNTCADLLVQYWQRHDLLPMLHGYAGEAVVPESERVAMETALQAAMRASPRSHIRFIAFPGTMFSSPHHVTFFLRGDEPLTSRLLQPVLVDARTGAVTAAPHTPWYLTALLLSQPLHFGDYGGLPMKILWALLDVAAIVILGSGAYLWLERRRPPRPAARNDAR